MPARGVAKVSIVLAVLAAACGGSSDARSRATSSTTIAATSSTDAPSSTTRSTIAPATTTPVASTSPPATAAPPPTAAAPPEPLLATSLAGVGSAEQVIAVAAGGYGTNVALLIAYERSAAGWRQVFGPWLANLGRNGVAPPGEKREGDGRTPSGAFGFDFMFGVNPNPGVKFPFRAITGTNIVWDDDPASPNYNRWIDTNSAFAGASPEAMYVGAYSAGAVIAYNTARTPGLGSAIFLHPSSGGPTAGCVALPSGELVPLLRWLDPVRQPRIIIGTLASITS